MGFMENTTFHPTSFEDVVFGALQKKGKKKYKHDNCTNYTTTNMISEIR